MRADGRKNVGRFPDERGARTGETFGGKPRHGKVRARADLADAPKEPVEPPCKRVAEARRIEPHQARRSPRARRPRSGSKRMRVGERHRGDGTAPAMELGRDAPMRLGMGEARRDGGLLGSAVQRRRCQPALRQIECRPSAPTTSRAVISMPCFKLNTAWFGASSMRSTLDG